MSPDFDDDSITAAKRSRYPYSRYGRPSKPPKGKVGGGQKRPWVWVAVLVVGAGVALLLAAGLSSSSSLNRYLPFPKKLLTVQLLHNGEKITLEDNARLILNPRDTVQLLEWKTDGWVQWGTKAVGKDLPLGLIQKRATPIGSLWPNESFETPKEFQLQVWWRDLLLGTVWGVVQLDARDWLQKAQAVTDPDQRIAYFQKALAENPGNVLVKTQLANTYLENKKYAQAAALLEEISQKGKSREVLENLLKAYQYQGKLEQALNVYLDLIKLTADADIFKLFVQYVHKQRDRQLVTNFLTRNEKDFPKEFQMNVVLMLAEFHSQNRDWGKAAAAYEDAIRRGARDQNVYYNLAIAYQQNKDFGRSAKAMSVYVQKNPKDLRSQVDLAQLQEKQGALDQARATYEAILREDPNQEKILLRLIALLEKSHDKVALRTNYQRLVKMDPKNKVAQFNLGVLHYEAKNWAEATTAFEAVAGLDPKDLESRKHLLDLYRKQKNAKGETSMLQQLVALQPDQGGYLDSLFSLYDKKQDYRAMVDLFKELAKGRPDSVPIHQYLLYGLLKTGNKKGAVAELDQLIRLQPKEKKHLRQAASLYEELGNYPEAAKKLEQLLKLDPKNKEAQDDYLRIRRHLLGTQKPAKSSR